MRFYKQSTPKAFNDRCMAIPYFQISDNWKWLPTIYRMLLQLAQWNRKDKESKNGISDVPRKYFSNHFSSEYPQIVGAIESHFLIIHRHGRGIKGLRNYGYTLTEEGLNVLSDATKEYLYNIVNDRTAIRRNQKRISDRHYHQKVYGDTRDLLKQTIDGIDISPEVHKAIEQHIKTYSSEEKVFIRTLLISIKEKSYGELDFNESDGRVPNPFTQLPADIKQLITIRGSKQIVVGDIRSCYPSLWAIYINKQFPDMDITEERNRYERLFLDPAVDPKEALSRELNIARKDIKEVLIAYFNGKGFNKKNAFYITSKRNPYYRFNEWLKSQFPRMYSLWLTTDISRTGNNIGKQFESALMLHPSIYQKAQELDLILGYENDGFSIYGSVEASHPTITAFLNYVMKRSVELLGIQVVFTTKSQTIDAEEWIIEHHTKRAEQIHTDWIKYCRRSFADKSITPDWKKFRDRQKQYQKKMLFHNQYI